MDQDGKLMYTSFSSGRLISSGDAGGDGCTTR